MPSLKLAAKAALPVSTSAPPEDNFRCSIVSSRAQGRLKFIIQHQGNTRLAPRSPNTQTPAALGHGSQAHADLHDPESESRLPPSQGEPPANVTPLWRCWAWRTRRTKSSGVPSPVFRAAQNKRPPMAVPELGVPGVKRDELVC